MSLLRVVQTPAGTFTLTEDARAVGHRLKVIFALAKCISWSCQNYIYFL